MGSDRIELTCPIPNPRTVQCGPQSQTLGIGPPNPIPDSRF